MKDNMRRMETKSDKVFFRLSPSERKTLRVVARKLQVTEGEVMRRALQDYSVKKFDLGAMNRLFATFENLVREVVVVVAEDKKKAG